MSRSGQSEEGSDVGEILRDSQQSTAHAFAARADIKCELYCLAGAESVGLGRPRRRRLYSRPRTRAVAIVHAADPKGWPRRTHLRIRSTSASVVAAFTSSTRSLPRGTVPGSSRRGDRSEDASHGKLVHRQASARSTNPARSGLRSIYLSTASRCTSSSIGNDLNRPCHTWPLE
jgi:hypothetical protein